MSTTNSQVVIDLTNDEGDEEQQQQQQQQDPRLQKVLAIDPGTTNLAIVMGYRMPDDETTVVITAMLLLDLTKIFEEENKGSIRKRRTPKSPKLAPKQAKETFEDFANRSETICAFLGEQYKTVIIERQVCRNQAASTSTHVGLNTNGIVSAITGFFQTRGIHVETIDATNDRNRVTSIDLEEEEGCETGTENDEVEGKAPENNNTAHATEHTRRKLVKKKTHTAVMDHIRSEKVKISADDFARLLSMPTSSQHNITDAIMLLIRFT